MDKLSGIANVRWISDLVRLSFIADAGDWGTLGRNKWLIGALGCFIAGGAAEVARAMLAGRVLGRPSEPR